MLFGGSVRSETRRSKQVHPIPGELAEEDDQGIALHKSILYLQ